MKNEAMQSAFRSWATWLLVLSLAVPALQDRKSVVELQDRLIALLPKLLSWFISFIIVCKFWLNHHHVLSLAQRRMARMLYLGSLVAALALGLAALLLGGWSLRSLLG